MILIILVPFRYEGYHSLQKNIDVPTYLEW